MFARLNFSTISISYNEVHLCGVVSWLYLVIRLLSKNDGDPLLFGIDLDLERWRDLQISFQFNLALSYKAGVSKRHLTGHTGPAKMVCVALDDVQDEQRYKNSQLFITLKLKCTLSHAVGFVFETPVNSQVSLGRSKIDMIKNTPISLHQRLNQCSSTQISPRPFFITSLNRDPF